MIPAPPLNDDGELAVNRWTLIANLVGGILTTCCACRQATISYWRRGDRYIPLHDRCVDHLIAEWRTLIEQGEADMAEPTGRRMGAYARRAAARATVATPVNSRAVSASQGSPSFVPGMAEGTPWTVVTEMPGDVPLITPCGGNEEHARKVNAFRRAATEHGHGPGGGRPLPVGGFIVDPAGAVHERWSAGELSSRADAAKLAG